MVRGYQLYITLPHICHQIRQCTLAVPDTQLFAVVFAFKGGHQKHQLASQAAISVETVRGSPS